MRQRKRISLLGATGSIGRSTLDVIRQNPERFELYAASGFSNIERLAEICETFAPAVVAVSNAEKARLLNHYLGDNPGTEILVGESALESIAVASEVDIVVAAIVGAAGLTSTLAAVQAGKTLLLANKEALVMSGAVLIEAAKASGATVLPIDSEHNAIFQCLNERLQRSAQVGQAPEIRKILLTASGGPFRGWSKEQLDTVTVAQAIAHPNWSMGSKISIDSATLMNKGLELIEACWLFNLNPHQVEVVVHPQSFIHSMVEYIDGSVLAQMGLPDMRTPIAHALAWPERIPSGVSSPQWSQVGSLTFEAPDLDAFPCLRLARDAFEAGGTAPAILNAANEAAVSAFIEEQIPFTRIPDWVEAALNAIPITPVTGLEDVLSADSEARAWIKALQLSVQ